MNSQLRIIGGTWRGRKLRFRVEPGLRPTPNRVRETLFNWLRQDLEGLNCLDLFAGSGALGFEAASRGATRVVQVERNPEACAELSSNRTQLDASTVEVVQGDVFRFLEGPPEAFDVVFLDPPFRQGWVEPCCGLLERRGWLTERARIYIESEKECPPERLPENWQVLRHKQAGEVSYQLCQRLTFDAEIPSLANSHRPSP